MRTLTLSMLLLGSTALAAPPSTAGKVGVTVAAPAFPGQSSTINLVQWDSNQLPKIYERSDQLPLTDEEVAKLSRSGFDSAQLVKLIEERRCACDASADGLIKLKKAGVAKEVLSAVSLHGLRPNRNIDLFVTLDFSGDGQEARENTLYFFVEDGNFTRVFTANISEVLGRKWSHESLVDQSDLMLPKRVRRVQLAGLVPLKNYGKHSVMVASSANPTLTHPSGLSEAERAKAQTYVFDYPRASLQKTCRLTTAYKRDVVLAYKWNFVGSQFECEWD